MAALPGAAFNLTGASGSQGLLGPMDSWKVYILPRGGHASQDSTGTTITFDSASVASRFAVNNWIQAGLLTANIRKVSAVGGNSIAVSGAALTVAENDRIFVIGNTQPSVTGGSATYIIPQTVIRQRDDDAADIFTNSMVTSNSDGLIQFWAEVGVYDGIIQDGNQGNQGYIVDLAVGAVEGVSTSLWAVFGASVTMHAALGVTGHAVLGSTLTVHGNAGFTGYALFGATATVNGTLGVTGAAIFGQTITIVGTSGNYNHSGTVIFGNTVTITGALGVTGTAYVGSTLTIPVAGALVVGGTGTVHNLFADRLALGELFLTSSNFALSAGWGAGASVSIAHASITDSAFGFIVGATGAGLAANPTVTVALQDGTRSNWTAVCSRATFNGNQGLSQPTIPFVPQLSGGTGTTIILQFVGTPVAGESYGCTCIVVDQ